MVLQVAVFALEEVVNMSVKLGPVGAVPASAVTCFQTDGVDVSGDKMPTRTWSLAEGEVGALLIGIALPATGGHGGDLCADNRDALQERHRPL